jgi:Circularly permutated YpsA SLOG family
MLKVISGGQTGADRIGLEVARELGFPTGGTAPKGFLTENGPDPSLESFGLVEDSSPSYGPRTVRNILDANGTVLFGNMNSPGSRDTIRLCKIKHKPYIVNPIPAALMAFIRKHQINILNVAGNRASRLSASQVTTIRYVLMTALGQLVSV